MADPTDENQPQFAEGTDEKKGIIDCDWVGGIYGPNIFPVLLKLFQLMCVVFVCGLTAYDCALLILRN